MERTTSDRVGPCGQVRSSRNTSRSARAESRNQDSKTAQGHRQKRRKPTTHLLYSELIGTAEAGGLSAKEVDELVQNWIKESAVYGENWVTEVRQKVLRALVRPNLCGNRFRAGPPGDQDLDEKSQLEQKAAVVDLLARTAKLVGKMDLAAEAGALREAGAAHR